MGCYADVCKPQKADAILPFSFVYFVKGTLKTIKTNHEQ
jgi:hypothetical protein